ncbi:MAG: MotA/TolQ/ExbB proton channel family protein [Planctomycetes bacterium]|nr:MotA/TolQ/ExbB proton channel family protein [Planctomycetota bacterium]
MIYDFIQEGGPWMYPILGVSVIGLTFILERFWFWFTLWLRRDLRLRRRLLHGELQARGTRTDDPRTEVILDLATYPDDPDLALERAKMLIRDSRTHLRILAIVSGVGSSLGLFGTVVGMSNSFRGVALTNPEAIVTGLHSALNTTVLGLVVYIVCHVAHAYFSQLSANLGQDLEEELNTTRRALATRGVGVSEVVNA